MNIVTEQTAKNLKIHKQVSFEDLHLDCVHERLLARTKDSGLEVELMVSQFLSRYFGRLAARWIQPSTLAQPDNLVAAAICECHGCDEITIDKGSSLTMGLIKIPLTQALKFSVGKDLANPSTKGLVAKLISGAVTLGPGRFAFELRSYSSLLLFSGLSVILGAILYSAAALLVIYGLAVFLQFLSEPEAVTRMATKRAEVGIALLSFLVGLAALLGKLVKKFFYFLRKSFRSP